MCERFRPQQAQPLPEPIRVQKSAMLSAENSMSLETFSMSLEAVVVNRDRGLVEAFVAVARPRGPHARYAWVCKRLTTHDYLNAQSLTSTGTCYNKQNDWLKLNG